jgi:hypothetical protein
MSRQHDELFSRSHFIFMDEALSLLRAAGPTALFPYYLGTLPFMAALLFFWNDMSHSAFAANHVLRASLAMALLFGWMKGWQAVYGSILYDIRQGRRSPAISPMRFLKICCRQLTVQPWGIFFFFLCIPLLLLPFPWVNAYFQNHTVMGALLEGEELSQRSMELARRDKWQNYIIIWILSPWTLFQVLLFSFGLAALLSHYSSIFGLNAELLGDIPWFLVGLLIIVIGIWPTCPLGLLLAVNLSLLLMALPFLLNTLFGIETTMLRSSYFWLANTTTLLVVSCGVYLLLDPLLKSAYVLRCFRGRSLENGSDLLADLRPYGVGLLLLFSLMGSVFQPMDALAAGEPETSQALSEQQLNLAIDNVLQQPQFAWRLPKDVINSVAEDVPHGFFQQLLAPLLHLFSDLGEWISQGAQVTMDWLSKHLGFLANWLEKLFSHKTDSEDPEAFDFANVSKPLVIALLAGLGGILLFLLIKTFRKKSPAPQVVTEELQLVPDLNDEETTADALPEEQWLALALKMLDKKEMRLALRALYLASLAYLEAQRFIVIQPFKSNRDYLRELSRSSHETGRLTPLFTKSIHLFEQIWYGNHPVDDAGIATFKHNSAQMRSCCE